MSDIPNSGFRRRSGVKRRISIVVDLFMAKTAILKIEEGIMGVEMVGVNGDGRLGSAVNLMLTGLGRKEEIRV